MSAQTLSPYEISLPRRGFVPRIISSEEMLQMKQTEFFGRASNLERDLEFVGSIEKILEPHFERGRGVSGSGRVQMLRFKRLLQLVASRVHGEARQSRVHFASDLLLHS